jgi:hypothetical protein
MRTRMIPVLLLLATILYPSQGQALDGERQGFFLGLGAGVGSVHEFSTDNLGFVTTFKIGGGPSNHVLVYLSSRVVYISSSYQGMTALGASYFLRPSGHSLFFSGELGLVANSSITGLNGSYSKIGFTLGIGYQVTRHLMFEANYMQASLEAGIDLKSYTLTLSWFAF